MKSDPFLADPLAPIPIKVRELVIWTKAGGDTQLFLPPIQRSVVWRNSQIINYWDSLLRGYPAGLMMVHRPKEGVSYARTSDGDTCEIEASGYQLFDGQQRLTAILLALGEGQLFGRLKLWVDLGIDCPDDSDLQFALRISSTGQPFGYKLNAPNEKHPLKVRRDKSIEWKSGRQLDRLDSNQAFEEVGGSDLIGSDCAVPLYTVIGSLKELGIEEAIIVLKSQYPHIPVERLNVFLDSMNRALDTPVIFQLIDQKVVEDENEYIRFFGRLGQGGTALTNDELTYSIIKHQYPQVHDRMREIEGSVGRLAGEVNLVLGALRVAKVSAPWNDSRDWQVYGRPHPAFVSSLKNKELIGVKDEFLHLLDGELKQVLESIRKKLEYHKTENPRGLPVILMARLPHQLVDALILIERHKHSDVDLSLFALYWVLFIGDSEKAGNLMFQSFCMPNEIWYPGTDLKLIRLFEKDGISRRLPGFEQLQRSRVEIEEGTHLLRGWGDRFTDLDSNKEHPAGDALRILSTNRELIIRALLWLQRDYLSGQFPEYDPTSTRDDDLPIDLDHLIPQKKFALDWRKQQNALDYVDVDENFRHVRWTVGNSLGNYRWLDISDNRSRQDGVLDESEARADFVEDLQRWNELIERTVWSESDVASFQRLIDLRTINLYEALLIQGGLSSFVTNA